MNRLNSLHNKTQEVKEDELPYNPSNTLLQKEDLRTFLMQMDYVTQIFIILIYIVMHLYIAHIVQ